MLTSIRKTCGRSVWASCTCRDPVGRFAHNADSALRLQFCPERRSKLRVVVYDQNADHVLIRLQIAVIIHSYHTAANAPIKSINGLGADAEALREGSICEARPDRLKYLLFPRGQVVRAAAKPYIGHLRWIGMALGSPLKCLSAGTHTLLLGTINSASCP
jgi:hypothetical protein